jgi:hypothetical protein
LASLFYGRSCSVGLLVLALRSHEIADAPSGERLERGNADEPNSGALTKPGTSRPQSARPSPWYQPRARGSTSPDAAIRRFDAS